MAWWSIEPEWSGKVCFILAGGPSVASQDISLLDDQHVIAVNSSWQKVPSAEFLFFGDNRWWGEYGKQVEAWYSGRIVTAEKPGEVMLRNQRILKLKKISPPGLSADRDSVSMHRTSLSGAINLAVHLGASQIVLLGADGKPDENGNTHHHPEHPWNQRTGCWTEQHDELASIVAPLRYLDVRVINASPGTALFDLWPVLSLTDTLTLLNL